MPQQRFPLITGTTGLNNKADPSSVLYNPETGIVDLTEAVNVDIDDYGKITTRDGQARITTGEFLTAFCNKGPCFVVQNRASDSAIFQLSTNLSTLTGIRSGLTKSRNVSFCDVGNQTFYSNGVQNGYIEDGTSYAWPDTSGHVGATTTREFYSAPVGNHIAYFLGCFWIAVGPVIYVSEVYSPGKFRLLGKMFQFGSDVRMIRPVQGGVWVSDSEKTGFISRADDFKQMSWAIKSEYPAHEWSANDRLVDLRSTPFEIKGLSAVWASDEGLTYGSPDGDLHVPTENQLIYPTGSSGATVVAGRIAINNIL